MTSSNMIEPENLEYELNKIMHNNNKPPAVAMFETVKIYGNNNQIRVSTDILNFLYAITNRDEDIIELDDAARGALIAGLKFTIQSYYVKNKRQFTKEDKEKILKDIEKVIDTQLNSLHLQQVLAH